MKKFFAKIFIITFVLFLSFGTANSAEEDIEIIGSGFYVPESIAPENLRNLDVIEKRIYGKSFPEMKPKERVEQLELDMYEEIQTGSLSKRISSLRLDSTKRGISGTAMTPMMNDAFNTKYINAHNDITSYDDVGLIDGLIRAWWPDTYEKIKEYRKYKEANFW